MPESNTNIKKCVAIISKIAPGFRPKIALILGSGLGNISDHIENAKIINYKSLPGFHVTNIAGHTKRMHLGILKGVPMVCLEGRTHLYEGAAKAIQSLKTMIRTLKKIGCEILLTTNAVGSLRIEYGPGSLMVIEDHINLTSQNPLIGPNDDEYGERFVSMDNAYDKDLRLKLITIAKKLNIPLSSGIYIATSGPSFETHAEIKMFKMLGGHTVGMSTVPEVIIARHCGLKVATVSAITNLGAGLSNEIISHEGTLKGAKLATEHLSQLLLAFLKTCSKDMSKTAS